MSEQEDIFDDTIESLEYSELKDGHQGIPPISSFSRGSDVVEETFESPASNYYGTNTNRNGRSPSIESSGHSFREVQTSVTSVSSNDNVITAAHHILGNVNNFVPSSSSVSSIHHSATGQNSAVSTSTQNDWTLPSASVSLPSSTQNTTMAVDSPQLHAALTMACLPTQNVGLNDAYANILQQQGLHNQQGNFLAFSPSVIPIGINASNTPVHGNQTIESANERSHATKVHETMGTHSQEKAMVELDKHRAILNSIHNHHQQQHQQTHSVLPVSISTVDPNAFMNSTLPTSGTVAPPNTQLPPSLSLHSRPPEAGLPTRSAASHVEPSNHPDPININVDTVVQQNELQAVDGTGNRRQGKKSRSKRIVPSEEKDDRYFERRKRNNQAAKRSRDARKVREEHVSRRADYLERENEILKAQLSTLREEANSLRLLLSQRPVIPTMITSQGHQIQ